jgi:hypothetical protein
MKIPAIRESDREVHRMPLLYRIVCQTSAPCRSEAVSISVLRTVLESQILLSPPFRRQVRAAPKWRAQWQWPRPRYEWRVRTHGGTWATGFDRRVYGRHPRISHGVAATERRVGGKLEEGATFICTYHHSSPSDTTYGHRLHAVQDPRRGCPLLNLPRFGRRLFTPMCDMRRGATPARSLPRAASLERGLLQGDSRTTMFRWYWATCN